MLAAWLDGDPVACGLLRPLEKGVAEIKRMYVRPGFRRQGLARRILIELEALAPRLGYAVIRLETGTLQPAAIALYQDSGYRQIEPFGEYAEDPTSVCFEKRL